MALQTERRDVPDRDTDTGTRLAAAGSVVGALAMTSCCILPLVLFSLGATGAWIGRLGALYPYKWYFFAFAGASIVYGFWKIYRPQASACADGSCENPISMPVMKTTLWGATFVVAAAIMFPYFSPFLIGY